MWDKIHVESTKLDKKLKKSNFNRKRNKRLSVAIRNSVNKKRLSVICYKNDRKKDSYHSLSCMSNLLLKNKTSTKPIQYNTNGYQPVRIRQCSIILRDILTWPSHNDVCCQKHKRKKKYLKNSTSVKKSGKSFYPVVLEDFEFIKTIGRGGSGKVILARFKTNNCLYAIKAIKKSVIVENNFTKQAVIERRILEIGCQHRLLSSLFCSFQTTDYLFLAMEYYPGGDLIHLLTHKHPLDVHSVRFCGAQVFLAVEFLHSKGVIYRDLKLDNILLDIQGNCVLSDFGMCKEGIGRNNLTSTFCGTAHYIAPEILKNQRYGFSVDWWDFGIVLYQLLVGSNPFEASNTKTIYDAIMYIEPVIPDYVTSEGRSIIKSLLVKNPVNRLGCDTLGSESIRYHPFFKGKVKWKALENMKENSPLKPTILYETDTSNFDDYITLIPAMLSHADNGCDVDQTLFTGFCFQH